MRTQKIFTALGLIGAIGAGLMGVAAPTPAAAQDPAHMSCEDLWGARATRYTRVTVIALIPTARGPCSEMVVFHLTGG